MIFIRGLLKKIFKINTSIRRLCLIFLDTIILPLSIFSLYLLGYEKSNYQDYLWIIRASLFLGIPIYIITGQYKGLSRYVGSSSLYKLVGRNSLLTLIVIAYGFITKNFLFSLPVWILFWIIINLLSGGLRFILRDVLIKINDNNISKLRKVAIYGAGEAGVQLAAALRFNPGIEVLAFFDDSSDLWYRSINTIPILPPDKLIDYKDKYNQILLAVPSAKNSQKKNIIQRIRNIGLEVLQIPSLDKLTMGVETIDNLSPISIEDILGRDVVLPDNKLYDSKISESVVLVTGGGGSIGSEICKQVLSLDPKSLIVLDNSELNLYQIYNYLSNDVNLKNKDRVIPILGSANDFNLVKSILNNREVDIIFHAAAYKHVPIVELNPLEGLYNNVFSTRVLCNLASSYRVKHFILVSTDKAVRPTNVMGASKRLAELIVQAFAEREKVIKDKSNSTIFSMVRFGNVLGSSGSVVPAFQKQINDGGPISLTNEKINRYFMTINEAAQLLIQSVYLAEGGDVFLLDMGDPVLIKDLAKQMIMLNGLSLKNETNPNGDIEIVTTGLRPGEKLFEETLITAQAEKTSHPLIFRAVENFLDFELLNSKLDLLEKNLIDKNLSVSLSMLKFLVPEWKAEDL